MKATQFVFSISSFLLGILSATGPLNAFGKEMTCVVVSEGEVDSAILDLTNTLAKGKFEVAPEKLMATLKSGIPSKSLKTIEGYGKSVKGLDKLNLEYSSVGILKYFSSNIYSPQQPECVDDTAEAYINTEHLVNWSCGIHADAFSIYLNDRQGFVTVSRKITLVRQPIIFEIVSSVVHRYGELDNRSGVYITAQLIGTKGNPEFPVMSNEDVGRYSLSQIETLKLDIKKMVVDLACDK